MKEAMDMEELRRGLDSMDLDDALMGHDVGPDEVLSALELGDVDAAKAAIGELLEIMRSSSLGGFPLGPENDLVDLVGFNC